MQLRHWDVLSYVTRRTCLVIMQHSRLRILQHRAAAAAAEAEHVKIHCALEPRHEAAERRGDTRGWGNVRHRDKLCRRPLLTTISKLIDISGGPNTEEDGIVLDRRLSSLEETGVTTGSEEPLTRGRR